MGTLVWKYDRECPSNFFLCFKGRCPLQAEGGIKTTSRYNPKKLGPLEVTAFKCKSVNRVGLGDSSVSLGTRLNGTGRQSKTNLNRIENKRFR